MSTSGISIWQLTRDEIIGAALRKIGVLGEDQVATATQIAEGEEALNAIVAEFITLGMPLWKRVEYPITLQPNVRAYNIGVGQTLSTPFPLKLYSAILTPNGSNSRQDVEIKAAYDFDLLPINSNGTVVSVKYQPKIDYGVLTVWPTPSVGGDTLTITYQAPMDVFIAANNTGDFPQEWHNAVIYQLALTLSDEYGLPVPDKQWLEKQAEKHLNTALSFGVEETSFFVQPDWRG